MGNSHKRNNPDSAPEIERDGCMHKHSRAHAHIYICILLHTHVCIQYIYSYAHTRAYAYTYTHTHMRLIHRCIHMHAYIDADTDADIDVDHETVQLVGNINNIRLSGRWRMPVHTHRLTLVPTTQYQTCLRSRPFDAVALSPCASRWENSGMMCTALMVGWP